ncbi:MAG TPA: CHAT domain-containing protein [Pyrinomonadaceae bacterium]|nr:CHAT domain-containing protein [Pyrinomonadaceae bacterium]
MFDERAFISQVESAGPRELAKLLERPTVEEERALRAHLGEERYQRMHGMALKRNMTRSLMRGKGAEPKGKVVVIHGIMGAELSVSSGGGGDLTWVNAFRIMRGWVDRLRLSEDGRNEFNSKFKVTASGIMKRYYGELLLALSEQWDVQAFWFDWRKDLNTAADDLNSKINEWYGSEAAVHIVAHSMGGLVARTFIKKYRTRWEAMARKDPNFRSGGRLVQLGTPNFGSFAIPQVITGVEGLVKKIALLDLTHSLQELLHTFNSFVGSYQMLPSPFVMEKMEKLYNSGTYGGFNVPQLHLTTARNHHKFLDDRSDVQRKRIVYVAGIDQPTFCDIRQEGWEKLNSEKSYVVTPYGDGRVPHRLGLFLKDNDYSNPDDPQTTVQTYYIKEDHGNLSTNGRILRALDAILETGETTDLAPTLRQAREEARRARGVAGARDGDGAAADGQPATEDELLKAKGEQDASDEARLRISLRRMVATRGVSSRAVVFDANLDDNGEARSVSDVDEMALTPEKQLSPEERKVEETVTRGFLAYRGEEQSFEDENFESDASIEHAEIEIGLIHNGIQAMDYDSVRSSRTRNSDGTMTGNYPVDAVSVGHYVGVQPAAAELALDRAISAALLGRDDIPGDDKPDLILTQYTERGIIHGKLGQPFFMPDPRAAREGRNRTDRIISIAGMGEPGRFGAPELTVLVRELCWALGRLNKNHLATVLTGTGAGNLTVREAVTAWMNGIRRALTGSMYDANRRLLRITFVEHDPRRVPEINRHIQVEAERQKKLGLIIKYKAPDKAELDAIKEKGLARAQADLRRDWAKLEANKDQSNAAPTRVTLKLDAERKTYQFGAITDVASVPEREIAIDPQVVWQANDELAGELNPSMQIERGRFLEELLMPDDLRRQLYNPAPLVMMLDSTTARIHWEMVAQPELSPAPAGSPPPDRDGGFDGTLFLGTSRGFTRQLRTTFAPPPEPPPPPRRILRVLVVADPAPDAHLPGAQEEGVAIADLFESYNAVVKDVEEANRSRVEVKRLFGPLEATRTNVLRELLVRSYDVLHFAGHCVYQWGGDPTLSGWIFNAKNKEILSANELNRIDRIPKFVFSNACESGITPDRSRERSDNLAPSFAEAFFARGVANFVCTAWPVDDLAAREFALSLYSGLLGIRSTDMGGSASEAPDGAKTMHNAMRDARLEIARTSNGRATWGAYQHYGNPFFQFFYTKKQDRQSEIVGGATAAANAAVAAEDAARGVKAGRARRAASKSGTKSATKSASKSASKSSKKRAAKKGRKG